MFFKEFFFTRSIRVTVELRNDVNCITDLSIVNSWALENGYYEIINVEGGDVRVVIEILEERLGAFVEQMQKNDIRIV